MIHKELSISISVTKIYTWHSSFDRGGEGLVHSCSMKKRQNTPLVQKPLPSGDF